MPWSGIVWKRVGSPNPSAAGDAFRIVAATSASNAWAVDATSGGRTLILHWDGTAWR